MFAYFTDIQILETTIQCVDEIVIITILSLLPRVSQEAGYSTTDVDWLIVEAECPTFWNDTVVEIGGMSSFSKANEVSHSIFWGVRSLLKDGELSFTSTMKFLEQDSFFKI